MPFYLRIFVERTGFIDEYVGFIDCIDGIVLQNLVTRTVACRVYPCQLLVKIDLRQLGLRRFVLAEERTYVVRTLAITDVITVI